MALDFGIITQQPSVAARYMQGEKEAQQNMLAQQQLEQSKLQTQMSRTQFEQAQKDRAALDNMAKLFAEQGHTGSLDENFDKMIQSGIPQYVQIGISGKQKLAEQQQFARIMGGGAAPGTAPAAMPSGAPAMTPAPGEPSPVRNALGLAAAPASAPVNALAAPTPMADTQVSSMRAKRDQLLALGTPQAIAAAKALDSDIVAMQRQHTVAPGGALVGAGGNVLYQAPEKEPTATAVTEYNFAKSPAGGNFKGSFQDFLTARARAGATPAQPQAPVAVVDEKTGKPVLVSREEALSKRMTPASAMEGLTPKEIQNREAKLPQATAAIKTVDTKYSQLAKDIETLANHPGLSGISGLIGGITPAITSEARQAKALYDSIIARGGFSELAAMRQASPTGGALGQVSDKENQYLRDAFGVLNRQQSTEDLATGLRNAAQQVRDSAAKLRDAYDMTYEYKQGGAAASTGGRGTAPEAAPAMAPIYATNGKERIMSTDGGQTWKPAR